MRGNNPIDQFRYIIHRPQKEALKNKLHELCSYSPEPRAEVYCFRLTFNISELVYCVSVNLLVVQHFIKIVFVDTSVTKGSDRYFERKSTLLRYSLST